MIVTIFRSRLNEGQNDDYFTMAKQMSSLAREVPGYISHKSFVADDGERVTLVEFETEEALQTWRVDRQHAEAKRQGIATFFSHYRYQICTLLRTREWSSTNTA
jgi:heme-degrading monooxygenase HmoA